MYYLRKRFVDYEDNEIFLAAKAQRHIAGAHAEIEFENIRKTLSDPDEVRKSSYKANSVLYYRSKGRRRFVCVVVKYCADGKFISSAMTTAKPKTGEIVYVRKK
ncbi:MAG: hypothetical protein AB7T49_01690 [Oligoflexales bacterium]